MLSADNQQERLDGYWIAGFVDGEGCFHVSINRMPKMTMGWQVLPEFRLVQHKKDVDVLFSIRNYFGFGVVRINNKDRMEFRVRALEDLFKLKLFFNKYKLVTSKKVDFEIFCQILCLIKSGEHLNSKGLERIAVLCSNMNRKIQRSLESSETIRRTSHVS